jgi:leucyl aminopeptidase (aminopeptidase T)
LRDSQNRAIEMLRAGEGRITTPDGTNLRFRVGDRAFNRQDGDASAARVGQARMRIDRHLELPAGVVRVAPVEETVNGTLVIPWMRIGGGEARRVRFDIQNGQIVNVRASEGLSLVKAALQAGGAAAMRFREVGIGFHPGLVRPAGSDVLPYFGYGAGVVRVSLGDNEELGGAVRGDFVRWMFLTNATVTAGGKRLVDKGQLVK